SECDVPSAWVRRGVSLRFETLVATLRGSDRAATRDSPPRDAHRQAPEKNQCCPRALHQLLWHSGAGSWQCPACGTKLHRRTRIRDGKIRSAAYSSVVPPKSRKEVFMPTRAAR